VDQTNGRERELNDKQMKMNSLKNKNIVSLVRRMGMIFLFLFLLTLNQWAQVQTNGYFAYEYINNQVDEGILKGAFANPLFGFKISGALTQSSNFVCEALFREGREVELKQAWINLGISEAFTSKFGLYMVPFGKYNESNRPYQTAFINPPLTAEYLYPRDWRDMGVLIEGRVKVFNYSFYAGNGLRESDTLSAGDQFDDNNRNKSLGGRFGFFIDQGFEVSYSHHRGRFDEEEERSLVYHGGNIDWRSESFHVLAEYMKAAIENPFGFENGECEGYFVQMSINFGSISPAGSFQKIKYSDPFHGDGFLSSFEPGSGLDLEKNRWSLGLVYRVLENVLLKVEYDFNKDVKDDTKHHALLCQMALSF